MIRGIDLKRYEIKYRIPTDLIQVVREHVRNYAKPDPYALKRPKHQYTVRSIYYDTSSFDFYYEKLDGLKIRKKLRIRAYDQKNGYGFLEIKRKYNNCVVKERAKLSFLQIEQLIDMQDNSSDAAFQDNHNARLVAGKFLHNILKKDLVATLLVIYEREPYISLIDDQVRVTIDSNVRCKYQPEIEDLFSDSDLAYVTNHYSILELKFNDFMPQWMRTMIRELEIRHESISKYCIGIDAYRNEYRREV